MCVLHVSSLTTSFKDFITSTNLPIYQSHEKGETKKLVKGVFHDFGFSCDVSEKPWEDFGGQLEDIELFIKTYYDDLASLKLSHTISRWWFDLPYRLRIGKEYFSQSDYLSPTTIKLLAEFDFGLELSLYPPDGKRE
ncbi:MAG: hypothetical protein AAF944_06440 [Bacteroidota bacterium]